MSPFVVFYWCRKNIAKGDYMLVKTTVKISQEDYDKLQISNLAAFYDYAESLAEKHGYPPQGYGFSSPIYYAKDGEFFVSWMHSDSCD